MKEQRAPDTGVSSPGSPGSRVAAALLLTRPYSWLDMALNCVLGVAWARQTTTAGLHLQAACVAVLMWWSLNWTSERIQRDPGRQVLPWLVTQLPMLVAAVWAYLLAGAASLPYLGVFWILLFLYPLKVHSRWVGPLGPLLRGLQTAQLFLLGTAFGGGAVDPWQMGLCLLLVQTSRSLSADIRDAGSDVFELPRLIGNPAAKFIVVLLLGLGIWVMPAFAGFHWMPRAILFLQVLLLVCLPCSRYYEAHMGFVLMFVCAKGSAYFALVGADATAGVLAILQILLLTTYWRVPRSANRAFRNRLERGVALVTPRRPGTAEDEREPQREEARS